MEEDYIQRLDWDLIRFVGVKSFANVLTHTRPPRFLSLVGKTTKDARAAFGQSCPWVAMCIPTCLFFFFFFGTSRTWHSCGSTRALFFVIVLWTRYTTHIQACWRCDRKNSRTTRISERGTVLLYLSHFYCHPHEQFIDQVPRNVLLFFFCHIVRLQEWVQQ